MKTFLDVLETLGWFVLAVVFVCLVFALPAKTDDPKSEDKR